jgi:superfamily II DNA or RNA helicase
MQFSGTWRDYQARVLEELDQLLSDQRVHIVAAPGAGKTILGLEIFRRIGQPALVLSPTTIIRDQWAARLVPLFLSKPPLADFMSTNLAMPGAITTATYQALHALWAEESDCDGRRPRFDALISALHNIGPVTLILDEAHHLRREWWHALLALTSALPNSSIISLTATPPYDAPLAEWMRYESLCGPVDMEISVPELVRNGDLCPHQDHVIFSIPDDNALSLLDQRRKAVMRISAWLRADEQLLDFFEHHYWLSNSQLHAEEILEAPEILSAILVFLASCSRRLPAAPLILMGVAHSEIPMPSLFWLEVLLNGILFRFPERFPIGDDRVKWLRSECQKSGLIEGKQIRLRETRKTFNIMANSLAKIESITEIAKAETGNLGRDLRMVILADHVRLADIPVSPDVEFKPAKLGVVTIFEAMRRADIQGQLLGVLTGTLVIIPIGATSALHASAFSKGVDLDTLQIEQLPGCPGYARLNSTGTGNRRIVEIITALFEAGDITILAGTQALLGEGWDAPAINSLVLASNSAAFMLSNQMRGRAIRINPSRPGKVANIWHLATTENIPANPVAAFSERMNWGNLDNVSETATSDLDLLSRRFRAFEGVANGGTDTIESGLGRLGFFGMATAERANVHAFAAAKDRPAIANRWESSLGDSPDRAHVRETASPNYAPRQLAMNDTLQWLAASAVSSGAFAAANELRNVGSFAQIGMIAMGISGAAALAALPKLLKAGWLLWRNGSLENSLDCVGHVTLQALNFAGSISDHDLANAQVEISRGVTGKCDIILRGTSRAAERAFIGAMSEILGPVQNPRYLLVRYSWLGPRKRADYHAIPVAIAKKKEFAEYFHQIWNAQIGSSRLVFTRTAGGRIFLLRARAKSFAAGFQRMVQHRSVWL